MGTPLLSRHAYMPPFTRRSCPGARDLPRATKTILLVIPALPLLAVATCPVSDNAASTAVALITVERQEPNMRLA
jgi:hypothetical protein